MSAPFRPTMREDDLDLLERISDFLCEQADAEFVTGNHRPIPNEAMRLQTELDSLRGRLTKVS